MMNGYNSPEMPLWDLKNTSTVMVCISLPMDRRFVYLNPARGLAAFCAPRLLANWNAIKWIYCSVHVYCDQKMKTWEFSSTILEQFGHVSSIWGACNLGGKIKDLRLYVWRENWNSLLIMMNGCNSPQIRLWSSKNT